MCTLSVCPTVVELFNVQSTDGNGQEGRTQTDFFDVTEKEYVSPHLAQGSSLARMHGALHTLRPPYCTPLPLDTLLRSAGYTQVLPACDGRRAPLPIVTTHYLDPMH